MSVTTTTAPLTPTPSPLESVRRFIRNNVRQYGMIVALALIVVIFQVHTGGILLKPLNVTNIFQQNGYILILAIGMVIVIISGHIDLSVGSIAGFIGAMSGVLMVRNDMPWLLAVAVCIGMGAVIGAWHRCISSLWCSAVRDRRFIGGVQRPPW